MSKIKTLSIILKLKEGRKKELELEVIKMTEKVDAEQSKLTAFKKEYSDKLDLFNKKNLETHVNVYDISSLYNYLSHINNLVGEQNKTYLMKLGELTSLNNTLIEAHKDQKMFEKMTDKATKKELKDKTYIEQKETDLSSITKYSMKKNTR